LAGSPVSDLAITDEFRPERRDSKAIPTAAIPAPNNPQAIALSDAYLAIFACGTLENHSSNPTGDAIDRRLA